MEIVAFPHPALRHESKPVKRVDASLRQIVRTMFDLMYEHRGVGLAANQVALPLRLFVMNLAADPNDGEEHVLINPVLSRPKGSAEQEEGCLSFPELYAPVRRPEAISVQAYSLDGEAFEGDLDGLVSRVVQHETDHLDGVVFTDRLSESHQLAVRPTLDEFELTFQSRRQVGEIPDDVEIADRLTQWEREYC